MNKERREMLGDVTSTIDDAICQVQEIIDEEQGAFDNLPESLQDSDRGATMEDAICDMEEVISKLEDVTMMVNNIIEKYSPKKK